MRDRSTRLQSGLRQWLPRFLIAAVIVLLIRHYFLHDNETELLDKDITAISTGTFFGNKLVDITGRSQALYEFSGKVLVINFWASWCPPCREEIPEFTRLQAAYKSKGVVVIGISTDTLSDAQAFVQANPVGYSMLVGDGDAMSLANGLGNYKDVLPYTVIINSNGRMVKNYFGRINLVDIEQALSPLVPGTQADTQ